MRLHQRQRFCCLYSEQMQINKSPCNSCQHTNVLLSPQGFQFDPHRTGSSVTTPESALQGAIAACWLQGCSCRAEALSSAYMERIGTRKQVMRPSHREEFGKKLVNGLCRDKDVLSMDFAKSLSNEGCVTTLNHWWEAPPGTGSKGRAVTCTFPLQQTISSSAQSDVTFEGGTAWNVNSEEVCSESSPNGNSATPCKAGASDAPRMCTPSNEASPETSSSKVDSCQSSERVTANDVESQSHYQVREKEKTNRWSDDDGKMMIKSDVFAAVLPSADEVGLQWRISELRVALRASESARLESEHETEGLRKYLAEVEAAAAGLQSRAQELERLISYSSKDETRELDQLRAKMAMEASKETRNQVAIAAQAVAAAREVTMELDKVKRHASALIKAQEEEIERLSMEAAESRTLYHARARQLQALKDQLEKMEQKIKIQSKTAEDELKGSQEEIMDLQKKVESAKLEAQGNAAKYTALFEDLELSKSVSRAAEKRLTEVEKEKKELLVQSELEKQATDLRNQEVAATIAHYDHELHKVQAVLGDEKKYLLAELASLRHSNQTLQGELVEWQEKFHALSCHVSESELMSPIHNSTARLENVMQHAVTSKESLAQTFEQESEQSKFYNKENLPTKQGAKEMSGYSNGRNADAQCDRPTSGKTDGWVIHKLNQNDNKQGSHEIFYGNGGVHSTDSRFVLTDNRKHDDSEKFGKACPWDCSSYQKKNSLFLRDKLLAAAHMEIVKLKEINQCLVAACQNEFNLTKENRRELVKGRDCLQFGVS